MTPSRWKTAPSGMTSASVRLFTFATTYLPRISDDAMAVLPPPLDLDRPWRSIVLLDARVEHLDQLLLFERARHLRAKPLDEVRAIALELPTDHAARPRHVDRHAVEDAARPRRQHDHAIRKVHRFVDVVGDEDDRLAGALPEAEQERLHLV